MNLYRRTFSVLKPYWKPLVTASLSAFLYALLSGLLVWTFGPLLMTLFKGGASSSPGITLKIPLPKSITGSPQESLGGFSSMMESAREGMKAFIENLVSADSTEGTLLAFCILILVVVLAKNFFLYIQGFFMAFVQQSVIRHFRNSLFEKYQRLSLDYFHARKTGEVMSRVTNDVIVLNESIDIGFNRLVTDSILVLVFSVFLVILSWKLTLMAMVVLPVVFVFIWFIGRKLRKYSERSQEKMADVNSVLEEAIQNSRIVKAFSMEQFEIDRFSKATGDYFRALLRMTRIGHLASPINDSLATVAGAVILLFAGTRIIEGTGELDGGDFMTYLLAMLSMIKPVKSLSQIHIKLQQGMAAAERVFRVIDAEEKIKDTPHAVRLESFKGSIRYQAVSFSYVESEKVLDDVSFEVNRGEVVAVVGPSGAGKSTLLDLLPRFYDPQSGQIAIDGIDTRNITLESLRSLLGIVTQETYLFNDTIFNNIAYGLNNVDRRLVTEAAVMANAHEFIEEQPNGYDTLVGNRGVKLSGGQRQRLAIARALLKDPQILIFDEATSALDTESEALVQEAIDKLMANRTTLVIAHRLSTIKHANRILVLDRGKIVEYGPHEDLMSNQGVYHRLYTMQFAGGS